MLFQNLAATRSYHNLDVTVKDALQFRESRPEGVTTCTIHESIETVANRLVKAEVRFDLSPLNFSNQTWLNDLRMI